MPSSFETLLERCNGDWEELNKKAISFSDYVMNLTEKKLDLKDASKTLKDVSVYSEDVHRVFEFVLERFIYKRRKLGDPYPTHYNDSALRLLILGFDDCTLKSTLAHDYVEDSCDQARNAITRFIEHESLRKPNTGKVKLDNLIRSIQSDYYYLQDYVRTTVLSDKFDPAKFKKKADAIRRKVKETSSFEEMALSGAIYTISDMILKFQPRLAFREYSDDELSDICDKMHADCWDVEAINLCACMHNNAPAVAHAYSVLKATLANECAQPAKQENIRKAMLALLENIITARESENANSSLPSELSKLCASLDSIEKYASQLDKPLLNYALLKLKELQELDAKEGNIVAEDVMLLTNFHAIVLEDVMLNAPNLSDEKSKDLFYLKLNKHIELILQSNTIREWQNKFEFDITGHLKTVLSDLMRLQSEMKSGFTVSSRQSFGEVLKLYCYDQYMNIFTERIKQLQLEDALISDRIGHQLRLLDQRIEAGNLVQAKEIYLSLAELNSGFRPRFHRPISGKMSENNDNYRTLTRGENIPQIRKAMEKEAMILDKAFHLLWPGVFKNEMHLDFIKELYTFKKNSSFYELLCRCYGLIQLDERRMNIATGSIFMSMLFNYARKYDIGGFQYSIEDNFQSRETYPAQMEAVAKELEEPFKNTLREMNCTETLEPNPWQCYSNTVRDIKDSEKHYDFWKNILLAFKEKFSRMPELRAKAKEYYDTEYQRMIPIVSLLTKPLLDLSRYEQLFKTQTT